MSELSVIQSNPIVERHIMCLKKVREHMKILKQEEEALITKIVGEMKDHELLVSEDGEELISYKFTSDINFFDAKKLAKDNPSLYEKYMAKRPGISRFLVK